MGNVFRTPGAQHSGMKVVAENTSTKVRNPAEEFELIVNRESLMIQCIRNVILDNYIVKI